MMGYKVVSGDDDKIRYSASDLGVQLTYKIGKNTKRKFGPLAVFSQLAPAIQFASWPDRTVWKCQYSKSKGKRLWYLNNNFVKIYNDNLPLGLPDCTVLADSVKLLEEIK